MVYDEWKTQKNRICNKIVSFSLLLGACVRLVNFFVLATRKNEMFCTGWGFI